MITLYNKYKIKVIILIILLFTISTIAACDNNTQNNIQQIEFNSNWNSSLIMQNSQ